MPAEQSAAELTTRDVLLQVDRRLTLIEGDLRGLDDKADDVHAKLDAKIDTRIEELDIKIDRRLTLIEGDLRGLDEKVDGLDDKLNERVGMLEVRLNSRIDSLHSEMYAQFGTLRSELTGKLDSHLKWTLGTMISLTGLTLTVFGLIVVFLKL